jgi:HlyD family secretion protein
VVLAPSAAAKPDGPANRPGGGGNRRGRAGGGSGRSHPDRHRHLRNTVTLRSRVRGRILRLPVEAGDRVQPDQLLAEIDVDDIQAQQRQAESGVAQARTAVSVARSARSAAQSQLNQARASRQEALGQLTEAQAQLEQARVDQQRFTYLEAEGAVPQSRLDDVNTQVNTLEARVEQIQSAIAQADSAIGAAQAQVAQSDDEVNRARERVNQAQAQVQQARANLDYGLVRAPFAGVVTQQHSEVGTLAGPGQPVVTLPALSRWGRLGGRSLGLAAEPRTRSPRLKAEIL